MSTIEGKRPTDENRLFEILCHPDRRAVLAFLAQQDDPVALDTLAENIGPTTEVTKSMAASLHHMHLPKLTDADLIAYDSDEKTVGLAVETLPTVAWPESLEDSGTS